MKSIKREALTKIIHKQLFENSAQINLPVDDSMYAQNTRGSHFDRPYAQKDQLPLASSDIVTNKSALNTKDFDPKDADFCPKNIKEYAVAISSLTDSIGINAIPEKDLKNLWNVFIKCLEKNDKWGIKCLIRMSNILQMVY